MPPSCAAGEAAATGLEAGLATATGLAMATGLGLDTAIGLGLDAAIGLGLDEAIGLGLGARPAMRAVGVGPCGEAAGDACVFGPDPDAAGDEAELPQAAASSMSAARPGNVRRNKCGTSVRMIEGYTRLPHILIHSDAADHCTIDANSLKSPVSPGCFRVVAVAHEWLRWTPAQASHVGGTWVCRSQVRRDCENEAARATTACSKHATGARTVPAPTWPTPARR